MLTKKYKKKANFWAKILIKLPGVLAIFLSGSIAEKKVNKDSDIDFFIITNIGQIFTARFFVSVILKLFGVLADKAQNHAGKICPNHYISIDNLEIFEKDDYSAHLFAHNKFLAGNKDIWYGFVETNKNWISNFGENFKNDLPPKNFKKQNLSKNINKFWQKIENFCKNFQKKRLDKKGLSKTAKVWLTDKEIRLHENPKNIYFSKKVS